MLTLTGGAIGQGLPVIAVAQQDCDVIFCAAEFSMTYPHLSLANESTVLTCGAPQWMRFRARRIQSRLPRSATQRCRMGRTSAAIAKSLS